MLQEKIEGRFLGEIKGEVEYYYCFAFLIYLWYLASRSVLWCSECTKFVFRRGFAPDPTGGAYDAPQTSSQLGRGIPSPHFPPCRRLRRLTLSWGKTCSKDLEGQKPLSNALYRMQVNLHGSPCIPGVFLYCFGHRKKTKFSTKSPRKYAILTLQSPKKSAYDRETVSRLSLSQTFSTDADADQVPTKFELLCVYMSHLMNFSWALRHPVIFTVDFFNLKLAHRLFMLRKKLSLHEFCAIFYALFFSN